MEGHHIRVDRAGGARKEGSQQGQKTEYDRSCSVFVGNLPFDVKVTHQLPQGLLMGASSKMSSGILTIRGP